MDLYDHISSNKRKSIFLVILFFFLVAILGSLLGLAFIGSYLFGLILAMIIGFIYYLIVWKSGDSIILNSSKAKQVTKKEDPYLVNTVEGLAIAAGIPTPKIYIIQEDSPNAFATGRDPQHASIAVTSGLRKKLNRSELEGVIAHEMAHIKNYDIRLMMLAAVLIGIVVLLSDIMLRGFLFGGGRRDNNKGGVFIILLALILAILAPIVAELIRLSISRKREYLADASGAMLTRHPKGLADALKKIRDDADTVVDTANRGMAHLYIENPLRHTKKKVNSLFSTHPDINSRIQRLEEM